MLKIRHTRSDGSEVFFHDELLHLAGLYEALADESIIETDHMELQGYNAAQPQNSDTAIRASAHTFVGRHTFYGYNMVGTPDTLVIEKGDRFYIAYADEQIGITNVLIVGTGDEIHEQI